MPASQQSTACDVFARGAAIAALEPVLAVGTALLLGLGARLLLRRTAGRESEALVITLALVFLSAGIANELGFSPLVSGMLAGAVIANLRDPHLRDLERGLQSAEPGMAVLMLLSCGSLAAEAHAALQSQQDWGCGRDVARMLRAVWWRGARRRGARRRAVWRREL